MLSYYTNQIIKGAVQFLPEAENNVLGVNLVENIVQSVTAKLLLNNLALNTKK